jgi:mxaJ protein
MSTRSFGHPRGAVVAALLAAALGLAGARADEPAATASPAPPAATLPELVVCADPSNLPYSNDRGEGFENRIASLLAQDLHASLRYEWNDQRRGFLRRGINGHGCDLLLDVPAGLQGVKTLRPLWTSSYVFVTRRDRGPRLDGFDDPRLAHLRIGLQAIGADGMNPPPAMSVALRGLGAQVVGFRMYEAADRSPAEMIAAVDRGDIDVAMLWGPSAGYFARGRGDRLDVVPVTRDPRAPDLVFTYAMAPAVRRDDDAFGERVQAALDRRAGEIRALLETYGVPLVAPPAQLAVAPAR